MFVQPPPDTPDTQRIYDAITKQQGFVMNLTRAWAWRPDIYEGFAALRSQLLSAAGLTRRDQAVVICAMASQIRDAYCSLAWGKALGEEVGAAEAAALLQGEGHANLSDRDRALAAWARKLAADPNGTTEEHVAALRAAGFDDKGIVELTIFAAFRLAFSTVNDALGAVPDAQLAAALPPEVAGVVNYGRTAA